MTPRTGRPPSDNPRKHMLTLRLTTDELEAARKHAEKAGQPVAVWFREQGTKVGRGRK